MVYRSLVLAGHPEVCGLHGFFMEMNRLPTVNKYRGYLWRSCPSPLAPPFVIPASSSATFFIAPYHHLRHPIPFAPISFVSSIDSSALRFDAPVTPLHFMFYSVRSCPWFITRRQVWIIDALEWGRRRDLSLVAIAHSSRAPDGVGLRDPGARPQKRPSTRKPFAPPPFLENFIYFFFAPPRIDFQPLEMLFFRKIIKFAGTFEGSFF